MPRKKLRTSDNNKTKDIGHDKVKSLELGMVDKMHTEVERKKRSRKRSSRESKSSKSGGKNVTNTDCQDLLNDCKEVEDGLKCRKKVKNLSNTDLKHQETKILKSKNRSSSKTERKTRPDSAVRMKLEHKSNEIKDTMKKEKNTLKSDSKHVVKSLKRKSSSIDTCETNEDDDMSNDDTDAKVPNVKTEKKCYSSGKLCINEEVGEKVEMMSDSGDSDFEPEEKIFQPSKKGLKPKKKTSIKPQDRKLSVNPVKDEKGEMKKMRLSQQTNECKTLPSQKVKQNRKKERKSKTSTKVESEKIQPEVKSISKISHVPTMGDFGIPSTVDHSDVMSVLLHMEGGGISISQVSCKEGDKTDTDSDEEEEEWEEVADDPSHESPRKSQIPKEPVEVTLDAPEFIKRRKKKQFDWKAYIQRQINRFQKGLREDIHRVHLMLLLARGMYLNGLCNDITLKAAILSLVPQEFASCQPSRCCTGLLARLLVWYAETVTIETRSEMDETNMRSHLVSCLSDKKVVSSLQYVMIFVALLRCIGLESRLVMSLQPLALKSTDTAVKNASRKPKTVKGNPVSIKRKKETESDKTGEKFKESHKKNLRKKNNETSSYFNENPMSKSVMQNSTKGKGLRRKRSKVSYNEEGSSDIDDSEEEFHLEEENSEEDSTEEKTTRKNIKGKKRKSYESEDTDDDFEKRKKYRSPPLLPARKNTSNKKILSSESEDTGNDSGVDHWAEVYLNTENKWLCVDCLRCLLNRPYRMESAATQPVHYVIAYFQDGSCKDVTSRYASKWMTETRKVRTESSWWEETLDPYRPIDIKADQKEDEDIKNSLITRPMPTSVAAFKGHPLYALRRHLLKFEAIYPESAAPLGFIRGEPVFARECVHELHSRENWLKEARSVRLGEKPYKMVKSRPKWKKPKDNPDALDLELFGLWQTEEYIPPPAVDGKVPRNEYGNYELFKPSMLPAGTVHLQIQGLNKVAKKLDIDCVPAMTGWDSHCGFSHPVLDGFIVCEEYKDILLAAWNEDQEIQKQREAEKREKRVLNNWKILTKGLLIKDRLKKRFDLQEKREETYHDKNTKKYEKSEKATDAELSWPRKQQEERKKKEKNQNSASNHFKSETI